MKQLLLFSTILLLSICMSLHTMATGLNYKECCFDGRYVYRPIADISYLYDELLSLNDSTATLYHGDEVAVVGKLVVDNYQGQNAITGEKTQEGQLIVAFDEKLILPKGETYTLVIEKDAVANKDNPDETNDEIRLSFTIPTDLGEFNADIEDGSTLSKANLMTFYWGTETESDEQQAVLYREGVPVRQFSFQATWDWDLGQACVDFGEYIKFEKGVNFALEIPEGTVYAKYRPDITNKKAVLHFVGGYEEPLPSMNYVWCSLFDNHPTDVLGEVAFYYNQAVMLSSDPKVQLWYGDNSEMVKEVVPTLTEENGQWVLKADFEKTPLTSEKGYTIVIPDGTLISANGDVVVNSRGMVNVGDATGISQFGNDALSVRTTKGGISVMGLPSKTNVTVCSLDGKLVYNETPNVANVTVPVNNGFYIIKIGNVLSRKVHVEK